MIERFFKQPKELNEKEMKERISWYNGAILERRKRRMGFEQEAERETREIINHNEDLKELKEEVELRNIKRKGKKK